MLGGESYLVTSDYFQGTLSSVLCQMASRPSFPCMYHGRSMLKALRQGQHLSAQTFLMPLLSSQGPCGFGPWQHFSFQWVSVGSWLKYQSHSCSDLGQRWELKCLEVQTCSLNVGSRPHETSARQSEWGEGHAAQDHHTGMRA